MTRSHLQRLVCNCVLPLNDCYLLVGTNGHLCVYNLLSQCIQTSVAHLNVTHLLPYKDCPSGSVVRVLSPHSFLVLPAPLQRDPGHRGER